MLWLMTLEEPPGHTYLILVSSAPQKLPENYSFPLPDRLFFDTA